MSSNLNSPLIIGGIRLPIDLSPTERVKLKLISHLIVIVLSNMVLSGLALLDQGKTITWSMVIMSIAAQGILALCDALKKYYSANGDVPLSTLVQLAQNEVLARAPQAPKLSQNEQAIQQTVGQMFDPSQVQSSPVLSQPVQNSAIPALVSFQVSQPNPVANQATSVQLVAPIQHPSMDSVPLSNTLPNILAVSGS